MQQTKSLVIYNASAGAGKTYTLVKAYLIKVLSSTKNDFFKHILALTFTNKAVTEMKNRIIEQLSSFAINPIDSQDTMFNDIASTLSLSPVELKEKSSKTLNYLLHNYASFEVLTIDKFTHKIIRTFAKDLKLSMNFNVEMDVDFVLNQAVDKLISRIGVDQGLTDVILAFALEKIDDDKSWDIAYDLNLISKLLLNENDKKHLEQFKQKSNLDFEEFQKGLSKKLEGKSKVCIETGKIIRALLQQNDIDDSEIKSIPVFLNHVSAKNFNVNLNTKWITEIETTKLYNSSTPNHKILTIERIQPQIASNINCIKQAVLYCKFYKNLLKNSTPLSVVNAIQKELDLLKEEQNILLISDFNDLIFSTIKDQPIPFIYERLGEKFKHYFIDEFQDTSTMQWENLIPLTDNAITQLNENGENGQLFVVGDAKQSIYRWRGANVQQFINLCNSKVPFSLNSEQIFIDNLPHNYRSYNEIIQFNNSFFKHLAGFISNVAHREIYLTGNNQLENDKKGGYIQIDFIEYKNKEEKLIGYSEKVLDQIKQLKNDYALSEICVLVRKKEEGVAIADYLTEHKIPIVSSESLLIKNSEKIQCVIALLEFLEQPDDLSVKLNALHYIFQLQKLNDTHSFYKENLDNSLEKIIAQYLNLEINEFTTLSFLEKIEMLFKKTKALDKSDSYVIGFLDFVFEYTENHSTDIKSFLNYWEQKKNNLSIAASENNNAVTILTIHKSKGLEFPVVIFPFADLDIYKSPNHNNWISLDKNEFNGFNTGYLNFSSYFEDINDTTKKAYAEYRDGLALDNYNLLYVTLTRAIEQLYIISRKETENLNKYSGILQHYLNTHDSQFIQSENSYSIGYQKRYSEKKTEKTTHRLFSEIVSTAKEKINLHYITTEAKLLNTEQDKAQKRGTLIHNLLEHIITEADIDKALQWAEEQGEIEVLERSDLKLELEKIIFHPELNIYFKSNTLSYNEKEIITKEGDTLIPDRLIINQNSVTIIDYKTGLYHEKHEMQISEYAQALAEMNYRIDKKLLVYTNNEITIKSV